MGILLRGISCPYRLHSPYVNQLYHWERIVESLGNVKTDSVGVLDDPIWDVVHYPAVFVYGIDLIWSESCPVVMTW